VDKAFETAYELAVRYLARRARSCFEMRQYLSRKKFLDTEIIDSVIDRLVCEGYLDDQAFARLFIRDRVRFKPKSRYAMGYELKARGIDPKIIHALVDAYEDMDLAVKAFWQRQDQWQRLAPEERKKKLMNYLRYRGFDYGTCMAVWGKFFPEE
jgi:regulatory protein